MLHVLPKDSGGVAKMALFIEGREVAVNSQGLATVVFDRAGQHTIIGPRLGRGREHGRGQPDGHGSTRAVADMAGMLKQQYNYDAYGNAHGFNAKEALTNLLYSGEQFNPVSGLQYLRARWYNPQSGRFNRLDPFAGNQESPLSFHKYAYAHMNPVMGNDPTGLMTIGQIMIVSGIMGFLGSFGSSYIRSGNITEAFKDGAKGGLVGVIMGGIVMGASAGIAAGAFYAGSRALAPFVFPVRNAFVIGTTLSTIYASKAAVTLYYTDDPREQLALERPRRRLPQFDKRNINPV